MGYSVMADHHRNGKKSGKNRKAFYFYHDWNTCKRIAFLSLAISLLSSCTTEGNFKGIFPIIEESVQSAKGDQRVIEDYVKQGENVDAMHYCDKQKGQRKLDCYAIYAKSLQKHGYFTDAAVYFMALNDDNGVTEIADTLFNMNDLENSGKYYEKTENTQGLINVADAYFQRKEYKKAAVYYEKAGYKEGHKKIAEIYFSNAAYMNAGKYYEKAEEYALLKMHADKFSLGGDYVNAGILYKSAGDREGLDRTFPKIADLLYNSDSNTRKSALAPLLFIDFARGGDELANACAKESTIEGQSWFIGSILDSEAELSDELPYLTHFKALVSPLKVTYQIAPVQSVSIDGKLISQSGGSHFVYDFTKMKEAIMYLQDSDERVLKGPIAYLSIPYFIELLGMRVDESCGWKGYEEPMKTSASIRRIFAALALTSLTGQKFGENRVEWLNWWKTNSMALSKNIVKREISNKKERVAVHAKVVFRRNPRSVYAVAFSPDGKYAISGSDRILKLWDLSSGSEVKAFMGHSFPVESVAFSPDGKHALSGSSDGTAKLWDIASGKEIREFRHSSYGYTAHAAYSPDGKIILIGSTDGTLKSWDIAGGRVLNTFVASQKGSAINSVAFSPDGKYALSGSLDKTLKLWDVQSGKEIRTFSGHSGYVNSVAFCRNGKFALSCSSDKTVKLWDIESGMECKTFVGHSRDVMSVACSSDDKYVLSGGRDKTIRIWDMESGKELWTCKENQEQVLSVAFAPDGRYVLSGSIDGTSKLWDVTIEQ